MSLKRSTAVTLATVAMTLGAGGPAVAMPARDVPAPTRAVHTPVIVTSAAPSTSGGGIGTLAIVLLSSGALVAGAAAGFGGAKASAGRAPLHRH